MFESPRSLLTDFLFAARGRASASPAAVRWQPIFHRAWMILLLLAMGASGNGSRAFADIVIDPSGGTVLTTGSLDGDGDGRLDDDDKIFMNRNLGFTGNSFRFFDASLTSMNVSDNGNLKNTSDVDFFTYSLQDDASRLTLPYMPQMIAPLWDDYWLASGYDNQIVEKKLDGVYYSATWQNVRMFFEGSIDAMGNVILPPSMRTVQVALFAAEHTVGSFTFQKNDIAFSYNSHTGDTANFGDNTIFGVVGLASGEGNAAGGVGRFAELPGTADGYLEAATANSLLPYTDSEFILIRRVADANDNFIRYDYSVESFAVAVPEPGAGAALLLFAGCLFHRGRRSSGKRNSP